MDIEDIIKIVFFLLFFLLGPILKAAEANKKKSLQGSPKGGSRKRPTPRGGQTLSDWIEEVRKASEGGTPSVPTQRSAPPPLEITFETQHREPEPREEREFREPVRAHVRPVEVDIEAHVQPVRVDLHRHVNPIHSQFDAPNREDDKQERSQKHDSAKGARRAHRASKEGSRSIRAQRSSDQGKASIHIQRSDLRRAIILQEILSPPLALREEKDL